MSAHELRVIYLSPIIGLKVAASSLLGAEVAVEHAPTAVFLSQRAVHVEGDELVPHRHTSKY